MIEKTVYRNNQKVIEVRSQGGKLLYIKTKDGYEMKCPRTKMLCVVSYNKMLFDCLQCMSGISDEEMLLKKAAKIQEIIGGVSAG